jgi:hypothetical protein
MRPDNGDVSGTVVNGTDTQRLCPKCGQPQRYWNCLAPHDAPCDDCGAPGPTSYYPGPRRHHGAIGQTSEAFLCQDCLDEQSILPGFGPGPRFRTREQYAAWRALDGGTQADEARARERDFQIRRQGNQLKRLEAAAEAARRAEEDRQSVAAVDDRNSFRRGHEPDLLALPTLHSTPEPCQDCGRVPPLDEIANWFNRAGTVPLTLCPGCAEKRYPWMFVGYHDRVRRTQRRLERRLAVRAAAWALTETPQAEQCCRCFGPPPLTARARKMARR